MERHARSVGVLDGATSSDSRTAKLKLCPRESMALQPHWLPEKLERYLDRTKDFYKPHLIFTGDPNTVVPSGDTSPLFQDRTAAIVQDGNSTVWTVSPLECDI